jgi:hypothetical protein
LWVCHFCRHVRARAAALQPGACALRKCAAAALRRAGCRPCLRLHVKIAHMKRI